MTTPSQQPLHISEACIEESTFLTVNLNRSRFENVSLAGATVKNANLSQIQIEGAQLGGAYFHQIGMPPQGHPDYNPVAKQQPLRFGDCDLSNSTMANCNLTGVELTNCVLTGMTINGILVEELLAIYEKNKLT